jgi:hypothetical protein
MSGLSRIEMSALDAQVSSSRTLESICEHIYIMRQEIRNIATSLESIAVALEKR